MVSGIGSSSKPFAQLNRSQSEGPGVRINSRETTESTIQNASASDAVTTSLSPEASAEGRKRSAPGTSGFAERAAAATAEIERLRSEQHALAEQAAEIAQGEESENLDARFQEIQAEIERVASSATYRGQDVLAGGTFGDGGENGEGVVVSVPDSRSLAEDPELSLANPESARAAVAETKRLVSSASSLAAGTERAAQAANLEVRPSTTTANGQPSINSTKEAEAVARRVAEELTRAASEGTTRTNPVEVLVRSISGNLDPERSNELLRQ